MLPFPSKYAYSLASTCCAYILMGLWMPREWMYVRVRLTRSRITTDDAPAFKQDTPCESLTMLANSISPIAAAGLVKSDGSERLRTATRGDRGLEIFIPPEIHCGGKIGFFDSQPSLPFRAIESRFRDVITYTYNDH